MLSWQQLGFWILPFVTFRPGTSGTGSFHLTHHAVEFGEFFTPLAPSVWTLRFFGCYPANHASASKPWSGCCERLRPFPLTTRLMETLSFRVKEILDATISGPNAPAGLVFGAVNRKGEFLVTEASGRVALDKDEPVRNSLVISFCLTPS